MAVVGPGFIGRVHALAIQSTGSTRLVAVAGRDPEKLDRFADRFAVERTYIRLADLAADPEVDAVVLATPNHTHLPMAVELLDAGKHVLVEKPLARTAAEAARLAEAARTSQGRLMVGHMWRFDREARRVREAVRDGLLGRIVKTKGYGTHTGWGPSGWFTDPERAGGGALIDMGVHAIDTVRYLLGDPDPVAVYARLGTHYGDYAVDDVGILVISWSSGAESLIESGWWHPHSDGLEASTQLFGTRGYARLFPTEIGRVIDGKLERERLQFAEREEHCDPHMYVGQIEEFASAIREERDPVPGPDHGLVVMRICDAAYRSAHEDRRIRIEET